jgi:alkylglycerol monooxygenase
VKRLTLAALVASLAGDVLLLWPSLFLPGLVAFLVAQVCYVLAFSRGVGFLPSKKAVVAAAIFVVSAVAMIWPGIGAGLKAPVFAYVAMLGRMVAQAAGRATVLRDLPAVLVAVGAAVFMASDLTLALATFGATSWPVDQATLPTYYCAQGLIAFFILPRGSSNG